MPTDTTVSDQTDSIRSWSNLDICLHGRDPHTVFLLDDQLVTVAARASCSGRTHTEAEEQ